MSTCEACGEEFAPSRAGQFFCNGEACTKARRNKRAREHMRAKRGNKPRVRQGRTEEDRAEVVRVRYARVWARAMVREVYAASVRCEERGGGYGEETGVGTVLGVDA